MIIYPTKDDENFVKKKLNVKTYDIFRKSENKNFLKKNVIKKPWGFEYLFYSQKKFSLWVLYFKKNAQTSMHAHLKKKTYLINSNFVYFSTLKKKLKISPYNLIEINKGSFHQTKNFPISSNLVFEIEIPNFKHDLFRYNDSYNRPNIGYEKMIEKSRLSKIIKKKIKKKCIFIYDFKKINNKNLKGNEIIVLLKGTLKINNTALKLYKPLDLSIFNKSIHFKNNKSAKIIVINKSL